MYGLLYFKAESAKKSTFFHSSSECSVNQFPNPKIAKYNPKVICVVCWFGVSNFWSLKCPFYAMSHLLNYFVLLYCSYMCYVLIRISFNLLLVYALIYAWLQFITFTFIQPELLQFINNSIRAVLRCFCLGGGGFLTVWQTTVTRKTMKIQWPTLLQCDQLSCNFKHIGTWCP